MGTVWYLARQDTKELFELGKTGFWFADANGLSNDNPNPAWADDWGAVYTMLGHYGFDEATRSSAADRISAFIGPGAVMVDEHELDCCDANDSDYKWQGEVYVVVDGVYWKKRD